MTWTTFGKVVLLILIFAFVNTFVKCMHDMKCTACRKPCAAAVTP